MECLLNGQGKALDQSQEPTNNIGGELINRNSGYLEGEPSRTAPQPEEPKAQPDFPTNVKLYFNIDKSVKSSYRLRGYAVEFFRMPNSIYFLGEHHRVLKKD